MSLKEWKNQELNRLLMKKFGLVSEAKGEKGSADPLGGEREKFDKDLDGVPDGADKDKEDPEIKEEVSEEVKSESVNIREALKIALGILESKLEK